MLNNEMNKPLCETLSLEIKKFMTNSIEGDYLNMLN